MKISCQMRKGVFNIIIGLLLRLGHRLRLIGIPNASKLGLLANALKWDGKRIDEVLEIMNKARNFYELENVAVHAGQGADRSRQGIL